MNEFKPVKLGKIETEPHFNTNNDTYDDVGHNACIVRPGGIINHHSKSKSNKLSVQFDLDDMMGDSCNNHSEKIDKINHEIQSIDSKLKVNQSEILMSKFDNELLNKREQLVNKIKKIENQVLTPLKIDPETKAKLYDEWKKS